MIREERHIRELEVRRPKLEDGSWNTSRFDKTYRDGLAEFASLSEISGQRSVVVFSHSFQFEGSLPANRFEITIGYNDGIENSMSSTVDLCRGITERDKMTYELHNLPNEFYKMSNKLTFMDSEFGKSKIELRSMSSLPNKMEAELSRNVKNCGRSNYSFNRINKNVEREGIVSSRQKDFYNRKQENCSRTSYFETGTCSWVSGSFSMCCAAEDMRDLSQNSSWRKERSVTMEQYSYRFLTFTSSGFGMTESSKLKAQSSQLEALYVLDLRLITYDSILTTNISTIKYNNSPSRRVRTNNKTSHLSQLKTVGAREQIKTPIFLNRNKGFLSSPLGGSPEGEGGPIYKRGEEGYKTFTNNLKTKDAYET